MRRMVWLFAGVMLIGALGHNAIMHAKGSEQKGDKAPKPRTPIDHVIVIIGENRSFDHVFGAYIPPKGQSVYNLLSEGIINADGTPGPNFNKAEQIQATDTGVYSLNPTSAGAYTALPQANTDGTPTNPYFTSITAAKAAEAGLPPDAYNLLLIGGSNQANGVVDTRFPASPANGPFQITNYISYDDYAGSPVHRFYQMWQQQDCNVAYATTSDPAGCRHDLYPWVEDTVGAGTNGKPQPIPFTNETTGEGNISMGFYNTNSGDEPYFTSLAKQYAISDNYHQAVQGGTGANHIALGTGDAIFYSDGNGHPLVPPPNQIENPNPQPGTNNWYTQDGYSGGTYSDCSDMTQPGVGPVMTYLQSLPYITFNNGNCASGAYYLLNNYNPGYNADGTVNHAPFTVPPSSVPTIADDLIDHNLSWSYYGEGWANGHPDNAYCTICNPFQYETRIMTNPAQRGNIHGIYQFYSDIAMNRLPAVSIVKPDGWVDGHPASSKFELFEDFTRKIIGKVQSNPQLWQHTAIFITVDESGGYYDSGYIQPLDFFGDGPRIPLIVVSPYSTGGKVAHNYSDHVSLMKFIEANWGLPPISNRSRDNMPNPVPSTANPYVPVNSPAIDNLMEMFRFE